MATTTATRAQRFRASWIEVPASRLRRYRARRARTSTYRTPDGMTRELLRSIVD